MRPGSAQANASSSPAQLDVFEEPVFVCAIDEIDESAGLADEERSSQISELPGESFEDIFS